MTPEQLEDAVIATLSRGNDVREWPADEQDLHRAEGWPSFSDRNEGVARYRARKIIQLCRGDSPAA
jgi:hypothetical protein